MLNAVLADPVVLADHEPCPGGLDLLEDSGSRQNVRQILLEPLAPDPDQRRTGYLAFGKSAHAVAKKREENGTLVRLCFPDAKTVLVCALANAHVGMACKGIFHAFSSRESPCYQQVFGKNGYNIPIFDYIWYMIAFFPLISNCFMKNATFVCLAS